MHFCSFRNKNQNFHHPDQDDNLKYILRKIEEALEENQRDLLLKTTQIFPTNLKKVEKPKMDNLVQDQDMLELKDLQSSIMKRQGSVIKFWFR